MERIRSALARFARGGTDSAVCVTIDPPADVFPVNELVKTLELVPDWQPASAREGWRRPPRVLVNAASTALLDWLQPAAPDVELLSFQGPEDGLAKVTDTDAVIGYLSPQMLEAGRELRWVQLHVAGVEAVLPSHPARGRGLLVTNLKGVAAPVIAEHAFAMLLSMTRRLDHFRRRQSQGSWAQFELADSGYGTLWGRRLLVVGFGGIGARCARLGVALGMQVDVVRSSRGQGVPEGVRQVGTTGELAGLLPEADAVINTLPLTDQTRGLFNHQLFQRMKRGALFANVGRGGTVVTSDLVSVLQQGRIGGACLDVVDPEPLPAGHPLWKMPNVLLTPHIAGLHGTGQAVAWTLIRENLRRYVAGEAMLSVVNLERGY